MLSCGCRLSGCVGRTDSAGVSVPTVGHSPVPILVADEFSITSRAVVADDKASEEPFNPFAKPDEAGITVYDPWEPLNGCSSRW